VTRSDFNGRGTEELGALLAGERTEDGAAPSGEADGAEELRAPLVAEKADVTAEAEVNAEVEVVGAMLARARVELLATETEATKLANISQGAVLRFCLRRRFDGEIDAPGVAVELAHKPWLVGCRIRKKRYFHLPISPAVLREIQGNIVAFRPFQTSALPSGANFQIMQTLL
jgi:hypothetical protein